MTWLAASFLRRSEWSSVLIASANALNTAISGTLLVEKKIEWVVVKWIEQFFG
jgi:hypothetical protein